jgi:hypothetical protein
MGHSGIGLGGVILIVLVILWLLGKLLAPQVIEMIGFILVPPQPCADSSSPPILLLRSRIFVKPAYIKP